MNKTKPSYNDHTSLVKIKQELENENTDFRKKITENEKNIEAINRVLPMLAPNGTTEKTNYEIVAEILKNNNSPMQIRDLHSRYLELGGKTERPSFDVFLGKCIKNPNKKIVRTGMGIYKYAS